MTTLPPNADELVSAYLDDEATPEQVAVVEQSDALLARVEVLRAVRMGLTVTSPAAELKAAHIGAALAEFDRLRDEIDSTEPEATAVVASPDLPDSHDSPDRGPSGSGGDRGQPDDAGATIVSLEEERERRRPWRLGLIAAAVVALMAVIGVFGLQNNAAEDSASDTAEMASDTTVDDAVDAKESAKAPVAQARADSANSADEEAMAQDAAMADEETEEAVEEEAAMDDADMADNTAAAGMAGDSTDEAAAAEEVGTESDADAGDAAGGEADGDAGSAAAGPDDSRQFLIDVNAVDLGVAEGTDGVDRLVNEYLDDHERPPDPETRAARCGLEVPAGFVLDPDAPVMSLVMIAPVSGDESLVEIYPGLESLLVIDTNGCIIIEELGRN